MSTPLIVPEPALQTLTRIIKQKKELRTMSDDFVRTEILTFLKSHPHLLPHLLSPLQPLNLRSASCRAVVKGVREQLRRVTGLFSKKQKISISTTPLEFLSLHASTRERLSFYRQLYQQLFTITGKPESILDLGCGLNPFSFPFMKLSKVQYFAFDVHEEEIKQVESYFHTVHQQHHAVTGKARILNLLDIAALGSLPPADLCFMFKITDVLDRGKGHKVTEKVIQAIPANNIVVSFSTKTMSGKKMTAPRRRWMEWLCQRLGYPYEILEFENETFYVVRKMPYPNF